MPAQPRNRPPARPWRANDMPAPEPERETLPLPAGLDVSRLGNADLDYLAEWVADYRRHLLDELIAHAWAMPAGIPTTATRVGINIILLARWAGCLPHLAELSLGDLGHAMRTRKATLVEQQRAVLDSIRRYNPRITIPRAPQANHHHP